MEAHSTDQYVERVELARFLVISENTLPVWDCTGQYDLKPVKDRHRGIVYPKTVIYGFLKIEPHVDDFIIPLLNREDAAFHIGYEAGSLAMWASKKSVDLKPIKIGLRIVRYRKFELDKFLEDRMKP